MKLVLQLQGCGCCIGGKRAKRKSEALDFRRNKILDASGGNKLCLKGGLHLP